MIRKAELSDISSIVKLAFDFYEESLKEYGISFDRDTLRETTSNLIKNGVSLVSENDGEINGIIMGVVHPSTFDKKELFAQEIIWYVNKPSRKGRVGLELIKAFSNKCKELGVSKIIMVYMNNLNADAMQRLYKRKKYKVMELQCIKEV